MIKVPKFQAFNPRNKAWVKYEFGKKGFKVIDVKQKMPMVPFKGVKIKGRRR